MSKELNKNKADYNEDGYFVFVDKQKDNKFKYEIYGKSGLTKTWNCFGGGKNLKSKETAINSAKKKIQGSLQKW